MKIPVQPIITETAPGELTFGAAEMAQYSVDMAAAKAEFDEVMAGAEDDADEITRRLMEWLKP